jgi:hypothetical protein
VGEGVANEPKAPLGRMVIAGIGISCLMGEKAGFSREAGFSLSDINLRTPFAT